MNRILTITALFYVGVVLSYPRYFIFNPFYDGFTLLGVLQSFSTAGWIIMICLPLVGWIVDSIGASKSLLVASVLVWPLSLLLIRVFMGLVTGDLGFGYLISSPVFIVTDFLAPALIAWWVVTDSRRTR